MAAKADDLMPHQAASLKRTKRALKKLLRLPQTWGMAEGRQYGTVPLRGSDGCRNFCVPKQHADLFPGNWATYLADYIADQGETAMNQFFVALKRGLQAVSLPALLVLLTANSAQAHIPVHSPEIDPTSMTSAISLFVAGALYLSSRRRLK
jgi:hypothetical protein